MGAGILPATIHNGTLYFLFGKENKVAATPGWSDFGGGTDNTETYLQTAIREGCEELTGFLGSDADLRKLLKQGTFNIDNGGRYRMHIFYLKYDPQLPHYYNNNQRFLQKNLDPTILETSKIFEKEEIRWISVNEMMRMRSKFRHYFQEIVDEIYRNENEIIIFLNKKSHIKIKTQKTRRG